MQDAMVAYGKALIEEAARPESLRMTERHGRRELEEKWLEEAYEAEAAGNPKRARHILAWASRVATS